MSILTIEQENEVYGRRALLIEKANEIPFFIKWDKLELPAKAAGSKLKFPVIYSGNLSITVTWQLIERIAAGEVKVILD